MELKATERSTKRYLAHHFVSTAVCLSLIVAPGQISPSYYALLGTIVFGMIIFFAVRCYLQMFFALRLPRLEEPSGGEWPRVSLIVPSYNEEAVLERSLSSMLALDYPADKLEFIYVYESVCTDRTEEIIQRFARRDSRIKPIRRITHKGGKAAATNYGLHFATGDIIGIFDADHALDPDLVRQAVAQLRNRDVGCVRGRCRTVNRTQNLVTRLIALERDAVERFYIYGAWRMGGFSTFTGGHAFFRRGIFEELGRFREDILTEDIDFSVKLHAAGYQVAVLPRIQSWEEVPSSLKALMHQRKRWTRGWMQIWRLHAARILPEPRAGLFKRLDIFLSLTSTVASGLAWAVIPLAGLRLLGHATSCFGEGTAFGLWLFVSTTPALTTLGAWLLDRREKEPPPVSDLLVIPLLIPYIFFLFGVSWICFADEFVWRWPFAYVKTGRAGDFLLRDRPYPEGTTSERRHQRGAHAETRQHEEERRKCLSHSAASWPIPLLVLLSGVLCGCSQRPANIDVVAATGVQKVSEREEPAVEQEEAFLAELGLGVVTIPSDRCAAAGESSKPDTQPNEPDDPPLTESAFLAEVSSSPAQPEWVGRKPAQIQLEPSTRNQHPTIPKAGGLEAAPQTHQESPGASKRYQATPSQMKVSGVVPERSDNTIRPSTPPLSYGPLVLANGEDVLHLDLPERLEMMQLLDLAAEYLHLDYLCDQEKIRGQWVSLRLHGKLSGEVKVKDLYPLLESILKFKGYAMTCHSGGLVTIVPVTDVLQVDPVLVDPNGSNLGAGDLVVTRVFGLQYVNAASAMNLLDTMKLSVAASPLEENHSLIVTCYAHRMARIERLLSLIDKPGRPKEFRFRTLKYTLANALTKRVEALVAELKTVPATIAPTEQKPAAPVLTLSAPAPPSLLAKPKPPSDAPEAPDKQGVYLDADERTNRILMIGPSEQLAVVEEVIEALDVAQQDPRILRTYAITHLGAAEAVKKLEELGIVGKGKKSEGTSPPLFISKTSSSDKGGGLGATESVVMEEMQVTVLEATNSLLVNATEEQHARIGTVLGYVDVAQQDLRTLKVYELKHVGAQEVRKQLAEFELVGQEAKAPEKAASAAAPAGGPTPASTTATAGPEEQPSLHAAQVSVLESTNSLLVNATEFQHARIAGVIQHVDTAARDEAIPYEIYFLENQEPEHMAEVLQKILQETIKDKDAKIEKTVRRLDEEIIIVPDKNTFSLIVYASMKNQEWIGKLVKTLDKRRPQVLIDATLVEITKSDAFTYDLNLLGSSPDIASTAGISGADPTIVGKLAQSSSGTFTAFYGDEHIQALLQAMQSKNYGRVLAKPKILVNDNEAGKIKTTDLTYVETSSSIPITSGAAGSQTNLVQTAVKYEEYEAGIMLDITPHISEGNLLRLDVSLTRSDFLETSDPKKPPNKRSNEVTTKVTVPDGSTIILGGLLKLNQNRGGTKVPILGDVPLIGGLLRGINNKDTQNKLYVFVKAEIIRPTEQVGQGLDQLTAISERDREAFEKHEREFQKYEDWPGIKSRPVDPPKVLEAR